MRSYRATDNQLAVSANNQETAINTAQTLDTLVFPDTNTVFQLDRRREDNKDEMTGLEEPSLVYDLGQTASSSFSFSKMMPQHAAFAMAYGIGSVTTAAAGTGFLHTFTPLHGDIDIRRSNPTFTSAIRYADVVKQLFEGCAVESFTMTFARDAWCKLSANIKATGKVTSNVTQETISALPTVTSLTLDANGVQGATAEGRLQNVHRIMVELTAGVWTEVIFSAVSDDVPAEITIEAPGAGVVAVNYKILYLPTAEAWETFPSNIVESPMRVSQVSVNYGGKWNGTTFQGGKTLYCEAKQVEWGFNNNLQVEFCFGEAGNYAGRIFRDGRTQTLKLDREFRDYILQQDMSDSREFGLHIKAEGVEFDTGHKFTVEVIFPKLTIKTSPISIDGKRLSESAEIAVLEDTTYGSVIAKVKNEVATYAA